MPYLKHPPIRDLIRAIPVSSHSVEVSAETWRQPCAATGCSTQFEAVFRGQPNVRICRGWLRTASDLPPDVMCFAILLWGYPDGARNQLHLRWLAQLRNIASEATAKGRPWREYYQHLQDLGGIGISTATKLACFTGQSFAMRPALILDQRILKVLASGRWPELAALQGIKYANAPAAYELYLQSLGELAEAGGFTPEQLEFFLFSLAERF